MLPEMRGGFTTEDIGQITIVRGLGLELMAEPNTVSLFDINHFLAIPITHKTTAQYIRYGDIPEDFLTKYTTKQVVEVGPGLGEPLVWLAEVAQVTPIAIEPANYNHIICLLEKAKATPQISRELHPLLDTLLERAHTYLDPAKIRLFPMTLEEAFTHHGDKLEGIADKVIDSAAALIHSPNPRLARELEEKLKRK